MKKLSVFALAMLFMVSCGASSEGNGGDSSASVESQPVKEEVVVEGEVFSNAPLGFLNIQESPSDYSFKIGELKNGPKGASIVEYGYEWTKISHGGVEGYVQTKYLQTAPTKSVDINFALALGAWCCKNEEGVFTHFDDLLVFDNGIYAVYSDLFCEGSVISVGTWTLEGCNLVLTEHYDLAYNAFLDTGWSRGVKSNKKIVYKVDDEKKVLIDEYGAVALYKTELLTDAEVERESCEGYSPRWSQAQLDGIKEFAARDYVVL